MHDRAAQCLLDAVRRLMAGGKGHRLSPQSHKFAYTTFESLISDSYRAYLKGEIDGE